MSKWTKEQLNEAYDDAQARITELEQEKTNLAAREQELEAREARLREKEQLLEWEQEQVEGVLEEAVEKGITLARAVQRQAVLEEIKDIQ